MKKRVNFIFVSLILTFGILLFSPVTKVFAQDEISEDQGQQEDESKKPVRNAMEGTLLIENQTFKVVPKGGHELYIHHRFGRFENGISDLYGIYAPSNIRLGFNFGITSKLTLGFGTEKNNKMQEFLLKYAILTQNRGGSVPVFVTYFGNVVIDGANKDKFGENYRFTNRLSYFNELIVGRKFTNRLSAQLGLSFMHFNAVDSLNDHDKIGLTFGGRFVLWGSNSFIFEYNNPLKIKSIQEFINPKNTGEQGFGFGIEFGTSTHCFQVFASNWEHIIAQKNFMFTQHSFFNKGILLGFNITVRM